MPSVRFAGQTIECPQGANLRMVLIRARLPLYTTAARALHCRGHGTCGTCAVRIEGEVSPLTRSEERRLALPPHQPERGLRLACQVRVEGDIEVTKHPGFFGHRADEESKR